MKIIEYNELLKRFLDPKTDVLFVKSGNVDLANKLASNYKNTVLIWVDRDDITNILDYIPNYAVTGSKVIIIHKGDCPEHLKFYVDYFHEV